MVCASAPGLVFGNFGIEFSQQRRRIHHAFRQRCPMGVDLAGRAGKRRLQQLLRNNADFQRIGDDLLPGIKLLQAPYPGQYRFLDANACARRNK